MRKSQLAIKITNSKSNVYTFFITQKVAAPAKRVARAALLGV
jgi:hypothetical protein